MISIFGLDLRIRAPIAFSRLVRFSRFPEVGYILRGHCGTEQTEPVFKSLRFSVNLFSNQGNDRLVKPPEVVDRHRVPMLRLFVWGAGHDGDVLLVDVDDRAVARR